MPLTDTDPVPPQYDWGGLWLRPQGKTLGALDLGGASTQITFETSSVLEDPSTAVQLRLYGHQYHLYTHSFLCYGRDQVLLRLQAAAMQVPPPTHCMAHPPGSTGQ